MAKITWKPGTLLAPVPPALISCGTLEKPNVMTAAWTGIISSDPVITYVSVRPSRFSHGLIKESGEFVINLPTAALVTAVDYCGVKSGKDIDKFKEMKLTAGASQKFRLRKIWNRRFLWSARSKVLQTTEHMICFWPKSSPLMSMTVILMKKANFVWKKPGFWHLLTPIIILWENVSETLAFQLTRHG